MVRTTAVGVVLFFTMLGADASWGAAMTCRLDTITESNDLGSVLDDDVDAIGSGDTLLRGPGDTQKE